MNLLVLTIALLLVELMVSFTPLWRFRRQAALILAPLFTCLALYVAFILPSVGAYLLVIINCYRVINFGRILQGRLHETYLLHSVRRTSVWLVVITVLATILTITAVPFLTIVAVVSSGFGLVAFGSVLRQAQRSVPDDFVPNKSSLPTVTVAIPARNETTDLEECLQSIIASDYPKLEILVLDDNSRGKAAEIIKGFAHDGVRFIPGDKLRTNWLAKNQAYQRLAHEANGQILLFCGVDIRMQPDSIRRLVDQMEQRNLQMLCAVPDNLPARSGQMSLVQPWRYVWEFALPRQLFRRPAVLSSCWLIRKTALKHSGGFAAVTRMIVPESYFAREFAASHSYQLVRSAGMLGISSHKSNAEQQATAIRTRYPQLHKRPEQVLLTSLMQALGVTLAVPGLIISLLNANTGLIVVLLGANILLFGAYYQVIRLGNYKNITVATLALPLAAIMDLYLLNLSMWRYEFGEIYWKGRPVTAPVMHATPHVPKV